MDIEKARTDHKERAEAVTKRLNEVLEMERRIQMEKQELINESLRLNGESRLLQRLDGDKEDKPV